ncbi:MAG: hypothetical protein IK008_02490 [Bacteroidales bacterium]|nr:hypothetical protein [Bacteroidales bacterium]
MLQEVSLEARLIWALLNLQDDVLEEPPATDYAGMLETMDARQLLQLMEMARQRLLDMGVVAPDRSVSGPIKVKSAPPDRRGGFEPSVLARSVLEPIPVKLYISHNYTIHTQSPDGSEMLLRPLVRALFILFLKHPEGILLKRRDVFRQELEQIYSIIAPETAPETISKRVGRLMNPEENAFSENVSSLNATLDRLFPQGVAGNYKIQGYNGYPRRILLDPLLVEWECS